MILTAVKRNSALLTCRRIRILPVLTEDREKKREREGEKKQRETLPPSIQFSNFLFETCRSGCIAFNKLKLEDIPKNLVLRVIYREYETKRRIERIEDPRVSNLHIFRLLSISTLPRIVSINANLCK